jgi:hypothetical protein
MWFMVAPLWAAVDAALGGGQGPDEEEQPCDAYGDASAEGE